MGSSSKEFKVGSSSKEFSLSAKSWYVFQEQIHTCQKQRVWTWKKFFTVVFSGCFPLLDIWEDQANSDDNDCVYCKWCMDSLYYVIRFDRNFAFVTLLAILDCEVVREVVNKIQLDRLSGKPQRHRENAFIQWDI